VACIMMPAFSLQRLSPNLRANCARRGTSRIDMFSRPGRGGAGGMAGTA
jgi:hypothetical protein